MSSFICLQIEQYDHQWPYWVSRCCCSLYIWYFGENRSLHQFCVCHSWSILWELVLPSTYMIISIRLYSNLHKEATILFMSIYPILKFKYWCFYHCLWVVVPSSCPYFSITVFNDLFHLWSYTCERRSQCDMWISRNSWRCISYDTFVNNLAWFIVLFLWCRQV